LDKVEAQGFSPRPACEGRLAMVVICEGQVLVLSLLEYGELTFIEMRHSSKRDINQRSVELTRQVTGIVRTDGRKEADAFAIGQVILIFFFVVRAEGHTERYCCHGSVIYMSRPKSGSGQIWNLPGPNRDSDFVRTKLEYCWCKVKNLMKNQ
jgi:hypothetical protein